MKQRTRVPAVILAVFVLTLSVATRAQTPAAKPAFTGTWKLNTTKSQFSPAPQPSAETLVLTLTGDDFTVDFTSQSDDGKQKYVFAVTVGAQAVPFPKALINETPLAYQSSQAEWKGDSIIVNQKISYQGSPGIMTSTYTLSADGKVLTKVMSVSLEMGDFDLTAVYDRV